MVELASGHRKHNLAFPDHVLTSFCTQLDGLTPLPGLSLVSPNTVVLWQTLQRTATEMERSCHVLTTCLCSVCVSCYSYARLTGGRPIVTRNGIVYFQLQLKTVCINLMSCMLYIYVVALIEKQLLVDYGRSSDGLSLFKS